ncbi:hypothetical protein Vretimale_8249 [Volvox reticuliferus]|uniref:Holocytochrome c-type synthase n=1 Tax=Volvox reticuliferus TaxID=1737510 RepID=A0A8J4GAC8_9CHLO|nr:hypothetical protein Vretimale_8249 [Volvox reticuliferus]
MVDSAPGSIPAERANRVFARLSSSTDGVNCGASTSTSQVDAVGASDSATSPPVAPSGQQKVPSSCSYAAAATSSPSAPSSLPSAPGSCPVRPTDGGTLNPLNNIPSGLINQSLQPGLNTQRQVSSIPMTPPEKLPPHQQAGQNYWVYPSEQMFYNAMKRKGWDPQVDDMRSVVAIHNTVNERAWREVMAWERLHCDECSAPRLKRFQGRPSDLSPKARLLNFAGFGLPFDRHDWVVDRCGREPGQTAPAAFFLDVRPALDSFEAAWDRIRMQFSWVLSGRWREP